MSIRTIKTYTATGAQPAIDVPFGHVVTVLVTPNTGTPVFTVEGRINEDGGNWGAVTSETVNAGQLYTFVGGVEAVRLNLTDLGGAASVVFEVSSGDR